MRKTQRERWLSEYDDDSGVWDDEELHPPEPTMRIDGWLVFWMLVGLGAWVAGLRFVVWWLA